MISPELLQAGIAGVFGLLIGSFLNVVIYRLPKMLELQWASEYSEFAGETAPVETTFNLMLPRSRCQQCGHQIRWHENIPVLSYLVLRGKCSACHTSISVRYPLVELVAGALFVFCIWRWGFTFTGLAWCSFSAAILTLSLIDWDTTLLPDNITLPLLWAGLILSALKWTSVPLDSAVWGAAAGYLSLWIIYWVFKLITGKEGMGYGDFKLFAALGAWFGWQALVPIILMASVFGALIGLALKFASQLREGGYVPFGPFLGIAGLSSMIFGAESILKAVGLFHQ
ncbi:MAG: A24 family peptidase [Burkholderiaceae bacterium]|nr:A24 family peptidase [Burkholderiaceae bacterium]